MSWTDIQGILEALVPVGALTVAGISLYLSYRERTKPHRECLWTEQLKVARAVHSRVAALLDLIHQLELRGSDSKDPETRASMKRNADLVDAQNALTETIADALMVLPGSGIKAVTAFKNQLEDLFASSDTLDDPVSDILWPLELGVLFELRESLGVDALSRETAKSVRS